MKMIQPKASGQVHQKEGKQIRQKDGRKIISNNGRWVGKAILHYKNLEKLGEGGMSSLIKKYIKLIPQSGSSFSKKYNKLIPFAGGVVFTP
jgi:hypothetical protein